MGLVILEVALGSGSWQGSLGKGQVAAERLLGPHHHQPQLLLTSCWVSIFSSQPFWGQEKPKRVPCPLGAQETGPA